MGVKFKDIVSPEEISLKDLEGRTVAIDAYNTIYQFLSGIRQRDGSPLMDQNGNVTSHLSGIPVFIRHSSKRWKSFNGSKRQCNLPFKRNPL